MRFALLAGLASLVSSATATALTYRLDANEKACFYTDIEELGSKVAFYFAVRILSSPSIRKFDAVVACLWQVADKTCLYRSNPVAHSMSISP